jgi:hypothetical protein
LQSQFYPSFFPLNPLSKIVNAHHASDFHSSLD